jgi:DNA (cytosine-5)-methyltransferase 1
MLNVLSLFSGIGAFEKALENLGIPHNVVAYCEIDKYASKAYSVIHDIPEEKNLQDVTKVDILDIEDTVDLITYGFPCQDISNAGKQKGFEDEDGNRTRSGLFFEALRIIDEYKPKFAIAENVKALTSKKFANEFKTVLESLDEVGYNNYYQVLNAKDYGIPQNRERVFIISIRKDIDKGFSFPQPIPLGLKLKDLLEDEVDEKYYLSEKAIESFNLHRDRNKEKGNGFGWKPTDGNVVANTLLASGATRPSDNYIQTEDSDDLDDIDVFLNED